MPYYKAYKSYRSKKQCKICKKTKTSYVYEHVDENDYCKILPFPFRWDGQIIYALRVCCKKECQEYFKLITC